MGNKQASVAKKNNHAIVIDIGSLYTKVGIVADQSMHSFSSRVATLQSIHQQEQALDENYHRSSTSNNQHYTPLNQHGDNMSEGVPIRRGVIENFDSFEYLLRGVYNDLQIDASQYPVIIPVSACTPADTRAQLIEIFFEQFKVPSLLIESSAVMSLWAQNNQNGIVIESGDSCTCVVPIFQCKPQLTAVKEYPFAGSHVTQQFLELLQSKKLTNCTDTRARMVKERLASVSLLNATHSNTQSAHTSLPDGSTISLTDKERNYCTEIMFQPHLCGSSMQTCSLSQLIVNAVNDCTELQMLQKTSLYNNMLLTGGNCLLRGFNERLITDLKQTHNIPNASIMKNNVNCITTPIRSAMLYSLIPQVKEMAFTLESYEEVGFQYPISIAD